LLPNLPIYNCKFIQDGAQLLLTGNRKHFYYYDFGANKLEKIPGISGGGVFANSQLDNAESLTNLSRLFVSPHSGSDYFAIAGGDSGNIAVLS
jgi:hypothetical protein